jgi:YD repeat-containing protein
MTSFADGEENRLDYEYDAAGNLASLGYPDGRKVSYSYDASNRLETVTDWADRITRYVYDANSQLVRAEFPNGTTRRMEYDPNGRIISRRDLGVNGDLIVGYGYSYDTAGDLQLAVGFLRR